MTKHTPTPWNWEVRPGMGPDGTQFVSICTDDRTIASLGYNTTAFQHDANAAFIIRAVNAHDALIMALCEALERTKAMPEFEGWHRNAARVVRQAQEF
jgi:hypothetical protein